jgi:hypothetical protein
MNKSLVAERQKDHRENTECFLSLQVETIYKIWHKEGKKWVSKVKRSCHNL